MNVRESSVFNRVTELDGRSWGLVSWESICYSRYRGPGFDSQHPHGSSRLSKSPVPEYATPTSVSSKIHGHTSWVGSQHRLLTSSRIHCVQTKESNQTCPGLQIF